MAALPPTSPPPNPPVRAGGDADPAWPPSEDRHDAGDPDQAFAPGVGLLGAVGLLLWTFFAQVLVVSVAVTGGLDVEALDDVSNLTLVAIMQVVTLAGVLVWLRVTGRSLWRLLGPIRPRWAHLAMGVGLGVTALLLVQVTAALVLTALPNAAPPNQEVLQAEGGGLVVALQVLAAVILAPIVEEVVHRGAVFQAGRRTFGLVGGMVISSLLFAGWHVEVWGSPQAMAGLLVLALWLAAIFHRTGSLVVPIVAHATFNGVTLALAALVPTLA